MNTFNRIVFLTVVLSIVSGCGNSGPAPEITNKKLESHVDANATITKSEVQAFLKKAIVSINRRNQTAMAEFVTPEASPARRAQIGAALISAFYGTAKMTVSDPVKKDATWTCPVDVTTVKRQKKTVTLGIEKIKGKLCVVSVK